MMRWLVTVLAAMAALFPAQVGAAPLTLEELLRSSAQHAPAILDAIAKQRQMEGRRLSAQGAFDLLFEADATSRLTGTYDGTIIEGKASQPLLSNGGGLYAGYRVSRGDFPIYEDKSFTNRLGEVKLGGYFALLRDRFIDDRRAKLSLAERDIDIAKLDRDMVAIGVQRRAIDAYQNWVAAGQRVAIYRDLLKLATDRQQSIEQQVKRGSRPEILATENRQNMIRREALLVRAEQDLAAAANALSLFLRDEAGTPVVVDRGRLPDSFPTFRLPPTSALEGMPVSRPDLDAILVRLDQTRTRIQLAENEMSPRLDVRAETSKDIGPTGLGGSSRSPTETIVGLRFSVPLQRRQARGRIAEAEAEAESLAMRRKLLTEQIQVEIRAFSIQVDATSKLVGLAADESRLANRMAEAERRRFQLGASDFLLVNLREESAADARLRQIDAEYRQAASRAELVAATVDREQLGL